MKLKFLDVLVLLVVSSTCQAFDWVAHRGNGAGAIENSIEAVVASWALAVDAIELDVRVSKDGVAYLFHDDEIDGRRLEDLSYLEISNLAGKGLVPKLSSILNIEGRSGYYVLDLKLPDPLKIGTYVRVIESGSVPANQIVLQSDRVEILRLLKKALPDCRYFYLDRLSTTAPFYISPQPSEVLAKVRGIEIDGLSLKGRRFLDSAYIRALKVTGLRVYVWTINRPSRADYYKGIGVDGVITDYAYRLRRIVNAFELSPAS